MIKNFTQLVVLFLYNFTLLLWIPLVHAIENSSSLLSVEQVMVTATRNPFSSYASTSGAFSSVVAENLLGQPSNLMEMISTEIGVAENGQPGLFQVPSIRGVSRQRVLTLIDGIRLTSERRAGVAASFIDPLLLQQVDILRGPSSTLYGSGALGGIIQLMPTRVIGEQLQLNYQSEGDEVAVQSGWGGEQWSIAAATRSANNSEDINGNELNTGFSQWSGVLKWKMDWQDKQLAFMWLPARGDNIGRSNSRFPQRIVDIPNESHDLFSMSVLDEDGWTGKVYGHNQQLTTRTLRPERRINKVTNEGLDFGGNMQHRLLVLDSEMLLGFDYFARRHVDSREREYHFDSQKTRTRLTLNNAKKDELALYGSWTKQGLSSRFQLGTRYTYQEDSNGDSEKNIEHQMTGFAGWHLTLSNHWQLRVNSGTGFRFASLTEKYFTGTTGRGFIIGNPQLQPEKAVNTDVNFHWDNKINSFQVTIFRNNISDYIERQSIASQQLTFRNITRGKIEGVELETQWQFMPRWLMQFNAMAIQGNNNLGDPLADIPSDRLTWRTEYSAERWSFDMLWQYRRSKNKIGDGEMIVPSASLLSVGWRYFLTKNLVFSLSMKNVLDEEYFSSADDLSTFSPGRNVNVYFSWRNL